MRRGEGVVATDILYWIDQLEALLNEGVRIPLTTKVIIDEDECLNVIDQLRVSIPAEIKRAKRIQQEGQKFVAQGQEEAELIVKRAREQAIRMIEEEDLRTQVEEQVNAIIADAMKEAEQIRQGADAYAMSVLSDLEARISSLHRTIENGIAALRREPQTEDDAAPSS